MSAKPFADTVPATSLLDQNMRAARQVVAQKHEKRNQARTAPSDASPAAPAPRGNLPNILGASEVAAIAQRPLADCSMHELSIRLGGPDALLYDKDYGREPERSERDIERAEFHAIRMSLQGFSPRR